MLTSVAGSSFTETGEVVYKLPLADSNYVTTYTEGFHGKEMFIPYNLPRICDTRTWSACAHYSIHIDDQLHQGVRGRRLDLERSKCRHKPSDHWKSWASVKRVIGRFRDEAALGCCTGNTYRSDFSQAPILVKLGFDFHHFDINKKGKRLM